MEFLLESPMAISDITCRLDTTTSAAMTQIKILMEQGLIECDSDLYAHTVMGRLIVQKMVPLLSVLNMYSENRTYWNEHDFSSLPPEFLERFHDLGKCVLIEPELCRLYEMPKKFEEMLLQSNRVCEISSFFIPIYHSAYMKLAEKGVEISVIMPEDAFSGFKESQPSLLAEYAEMDNVRFFACPENLNLVSVVNTDVFTSISLFSKTGLYHNHCMISCEPSGVRWGQDLFDRYLAVSSEMAKK